MMEVLLLSVMVVLEVVSVICGVGVVVGIVVFLVAVRDKVVLLVVLMVVLFELGCSHVGGASYTVLLVMVLMNAIHQAVVIFLMVVIAVVKVFILQ